LTDMQIKNCDMKRELAAVEGPTSRLP
jgi:hypothetical protein